jgi:tail tube protein
MTEAVRIAGKRYDIANFQVPTTPRRELSRTIEGVIPLNGSFELSQLSQLPLTDVTLTIERNDGKTVVVKDATVRASVEDGEVVLRFKGTTTDDVVAASDPAQ